MRTLHGLPPVRRDLIARHLYLVPNSIVVSRDCPHSCDFCDVDAFFEGGRSFSTRTVDDALAERSTGSPAATSTSSTTTSPATPASPASSSPA